MPCSSSNSHFAIYILIPRVDYHRPCCTGHLYWLLPQVHHGYGGDYKYYKNINAYIRTYKAR